MSLYKYTIFTILIVFVNSCSNTNSSVAPPKEPIWLSNPQKLSDDKLTAVGCATTHIDGVDAQKKLAISRAINEIALQKQAKISTVTYRKKSYNKGEVSKEITKSSLQEVENLNLSTKVMEYYHKPNSRDICVWVVEVP